MEEKGNNDVVDEGQILRLESDEINEIGGALAAAQAEMEPVICSKKGVVRKDGRVLYEYDYADLSDTLEVAKKALSKHGIAVTQPPAWIEGDIIPIWTRLIHKSGQFIAAIYPIPLLANPQQQGSAITYARRYSLGAICGIAPEQDDDGAVAAELANQPRSRQYHRQPRQPQQPSQPPQQPRSNGPSQADIDFYKAVDALKKRLEAASGEDAEALYRGILGQHGCVKRSEIGAGKADSELREARKEFFRHLQDVVRGAEAGPPKTKRRRKAQSENGEYEGPPSPQSAETSFIADVGRLRRRLVLAWETAGAGDHDSESAADNQYSGFLNDTGYPENAADLPEDQQSEFLRQLTEMVENAETAANTADQAKDAMGAGF